MHVKIQEFFATIDRKAVFATGFLLPILLLFTLSVLNRWSAYRSISSNRTTGLAATTDVGWEPIHLWQSRPNLIRAALQMESAPYCGRVVRTGMMYQKSAASSPEEAPRKISRTGTIWLSVNDPLRALDQMTAIAQDFNGYVVNAQNQMRVVSGEEGMLTVRVPAERFDEFRARIKALAVRVDEENVEAKDVTKEFYDFDARLRSLHAQEEQYLQILKTAHTVEDTLKVTEHLNNVRGDIERAQGEFNFLQKTVEASVLDVHLQTVPGGKFAALGWQPLQRIKLELRDGLEAIGDYTGAMFALLVRLPAIMLWFVTVVFIVAMSWRVVRYAWRRFVPQAI
jgi:uncharacterized protein DUF4349